MPEADGGSLYMEKRRNNRRGGYEASEHEAKHILQKGQGGKVKMMKWTLAGFVISLAVLCVMESVSRNSVWF